MSDPFVTSAPASIGKSSSLASRPWPSWTYWLIPFGVALLGCLPKLWLMIVQPPPGTAFIGVAYLPMDFLAYEAFIRQAASDGAFLLSNPFTTEPQSPRFILLFHWILGQVCALTKLSPGAVLEIARIALVFVVFGVLRWFLRPILTQESDRRWAAMMLDFTGGFESWIQALIPEISDRTETANRFAQDTWAAYGWNFLASSFNPLWLVGIVFALVALRYFLAEDALATKRERCIAGLAIFVLYWVHPYSALGTLAIIGIRPCVEWFATGRLNIIAVGRIVLTLLLPLAAIAILVHWQMQDRVYRTSSGGFFGGRDASVFWYPLTLGAVGLMALFGARQWTREMHPYRLAIFGWVLAIAFLHSSPLINGYHFVYLLSVPVCIVAATPVRMVFESSRGWVKIALAMALFGAPLFIVLGSMKAAEGNVISADSMQVVMAFNKLPAGNALVPPPIGNILPARSGHRVWIGHWFLTPEFEERYRAYETMIRDPQGFPGLENLLRENQIRYFVVPTDRAREFVQRLGANVENAVPQGHWTLLTLRGSAP